MKYQIQIVEDANDSNRTVIASKDELMNEDEKTQWWNETIQSLEEPIPEGSTAYIVDIGHGWFKHEDPQASVATSTVDLNANSVEEEGEKAQISNPNNKATDFDTVAQIELKLSKQRRKKAVEKQRKLNAAIAKLVSEQD